MNMCPRCGKTHKPEDRFCGFCGCNVTVQNMSDFVTKPAMKLSDIQFDLAILYFKEEKYAESVEVFQKLLQEHPDNLQVIDMLQRAQVALGELR